MFIHWGPVCSWAPRSAGRGIPVPTARGSIPAAEYDNLYKKFNPMKFDANEWVATAKAAGMKYMVFTSKHHDGFCEFDSKLTDYKITSPQSPFHRDVVKELADACHEAGCAFGLYYSPPDCHHPDYRTGHHARYIEYLHGQVGELLSNYGQVDVIWFDGLGGSAKDWDARGCSPDQAASAQDPDQRPRRPAGRLQHARADRRGFQMDRPWESCITICNQWA